MSDSYSINRVMRKRMISSLVVILILCFSFFSEIPARAAISSNVTLQPSYVADLDNVLYPSTSAYYTYDGLQGIGSFAVTEPTIIKAYFNWDSTTNKNITGSAWFSRDDLGMDIIGTSSRLKSVGDSMIVFLDPGTYYVNYLFNIKDTSASSWLRVGVALLAENVRSEERVCASSYHTPNILIPGQSVRGFLSTSSPIDYYMFEVTSLSQVTVSYNFEQTGDVSVSRGSCTLYDKLNQKILSKGFSSRGAADNKFAEILKPGTYYVAMSGATCATNILVDMVSYEVSTKVSDEEWTADDITVSVICEFDAAEMLYVNENVTEANIRSRNVWNTRLESCKEIENKEFVVTSNGTYTIRIKDAKDYYVLESFTIKNIDKTLPAVSGVNNKKTYKSAVTIKFKDTGSGIKKATLNGKTIKNGTKVTKEGKYTLEVYDRAYNTRKITFTIKR